MVPGVRTFGASGSDGRPVNGSESGPAAAALSAALARLNEDERFTPCALGGPDGIWTSEDADERAAAVLLCWPCPVLAECGAPLLSAYEAEGLDARTTMRLTGDAVRQGGVVHLRMRDKAAYNALIRRFPELREWDG